MFGIFIRPSGNGYEVIRDDIDGHFPMDWYRHHTQAVAYATQQGRNFRLAVFDELKRGA